MTYGVAVVERVTELLQGVQVFHVILGFVRVVRDPPVELLPRLENTRRITSNLCLQPLL